MFTDGHFNAIRRQKKQPASALPAHRFWEAGGVSLTFVIPTRSLRTATAFAIDNNKMHPVQNGRAEKPSK